MTAQPPHTCGRCGARWGGASRAHCSGCHRTFGGVTSFDKHRLRGQCVHPSEQGLTENERGIWIAPGTDWWSSPESTDTEG